MNSENIGSILVVRQHDQLGDMLCVIPLLRALHEHFPSAAVTLVASPVNYAIMLHNPFVTEVLNYDKSRLFPAIGNILSFYRSLAAGKHDLAIVPATVSISTTSNILAFLSGAQRRIGPIKLAGRTNSTAFCFTETVDLDWNDFPREHQTLRNLRMLQPLGISTRDLTCPLGFTSHEIGTARARLQKLKSSHKLLFGIHPGAGKTQNRWPAEKFAEAANRIAKQHDGAVIVTAGPMDEEPLARLVPHLDCESMIVRNEPIRTVASLINEMDLFITNDTGVMHVAGGTAAQTLSLFGPTDPLQWAPVGGKNRFIAARDGKIDSLSVGEVLDIVFLILQDRK
ncbi:MAG TPA: glycosyltransferase family 9 protein [Bacteroidota bacterium]|nr:glycosyltransferase family 9 protein [Bacteroidota bacterium]